MNGPVVLIACLKYSPVHNALCRALGEPLRPLGLEVKYLLTQSLAWTVPPSQLNDVTWLGTSRNAPEVVWDTLATSTWLRSRLTRPFQELRPSLLLFEASHPTNSLVAALARSSVPGIKVWFLLHEPYVREKNKHGHLRSLLIVGQEWGTRRLLPQLDGVLVPSDEAVRQMKVAYPGFRGVVLKVPLLFEDRCAERDVQRRYFSFIGHAVPAKGIDTFFELVRLSAESGRDWSFQIATSTDISAHLAVLSDAAHSQLRVINKPQLKDEEIDQAVRESWAVLAPYRRVTQSGVVPIAFMHGTPVISTCAGGMPECVVEGETGYLVDVEAKFSDWEAKFHQVKSNLPRLSTRCRDYFANHFDARRGPEFLRPMLDSIRSGH